MADAQPDETFEEEFRRRAREIIERHFASGAEDRAERIAEADSVEEIKEIESTEVAAPILDELLLLEAEMRGRLTSDPDDP